MCHALQGLKDIQTEMGLINLLKNETYSSFWWADTHAEACINMLNNDGENPQLMHTKQIRVYVTI